MVLVNDTHSRQHGPVVEYAYLKELWNVQKEALFQEILHSFGTDGKELYRDVQDLIQWCQEECGIDFSSQGHRFGNFEHYQSAPLGTGFKIDPACYYGGLSRSTRRLGPFRPVFPCVSPPEAEGDIWKKSKLRRGASAPRLSFSDIKLVSTDGGIIGGVAHDRS